ncbi:MAG TPA: hypothetical protein VFX37_09760 [Pseudolabrys sp.]|nr:hypothetical protein [Pseudolabrys sp.]
MTKLPKWHALARRLRSTGMSLSSIALKCGVSSQAVSIALDSNKQARRLKYLRAWNQARRADPKIRERHRDIDRASHRRRRAALRENLRREEIEMLEASEMTEITL